MKNKQMQIGVLCTVVSALLFGFTPVLVQQVCAQDVSSITVVFYRNFFCIFITAIWRMFSKQTFRVQKHELFHMGWIGVFGVCAATMTLYGSYAYLGVGMATVLHFLYPAFAAILSLLFCKQKISRQRMIALVLSVVGLVFFMQGTQSGSFTGILLAVLSAVAYAVYLVGMEGCRIAFLPTCTVTFYFAVFATITVGIYGAITGQLQLLLPLPLLAMCVVISFCTSFGAVVLLQIGVRNLNAGTAALLCLFEPVSSLVFGMMFLHEVIPAQQWMGSGIIIAALLVGMLQPKETAKKG